MTNLTELKVHKEHLIQYLLSKVTTRDWHAVQDAASDIREIDAKMSILREITNWPREDKE